ncbi:peroxidase family protein [Mycobacterium cookii]|uniref:Putative peroxidase n=1 Tax=Mycobacterium cookii TaxID=1775 RepID=A0A7I7KRG6_9MYCO|nr:peroxidase family protein [Mycobacterium cookii]MCV7331983.1 peroxidase [Mycobacterium cookii]BBX44171.1 putative peroxidase [Mycobacterium cookii]
MSYREALEALKRGEYEDVINWFEGLPPEQRDGKACVLAALAHFKREEYQAAAELYAEAVKAGGTDAADWAKMEALAKSNSAAEIYVHVPAPHYPTKTDLLSWPSVPPGAIPDPPAARSCRCCIKWFRLWLGNGAGAVLTVLMDLLIKIVGRVFGYRGTVWTNWYRHGMVVGVLLLAYIRERLSAENLKSTYPPGELVAFLKNGPPPPPGVARFRTADGSWNNLSDPKEGAANTRFLRNVEFSATHPEKSPRLLTPNPREISLKLLTRPDDADGQPDMAPVLFLNLLAASWIQFMTHDWISHGDVAPNSLITVPLPDDDPAIQRYHQHELVISTTEPDPTRNAGMRPDPAATSFINEVTHWWDGSQIYGSDQATQDHLRSHKSGKMRLGPGGLLPVDPKTGVEETAFMRNWWVGLSMLHTLFVREHNAICDMLHRAYPNWDDNLLFNVARLINAAVMAKIHSVEWTPAILPNQTLEMGMNSNWYGLLTYLRHKSKDRKTVAEINIGNPELGGIVGNPINKHDCVFGLSEEFVEVYRLHSLLPETLQLRRRGIPGIYPEAFAASRQRGSTLLTQQYAMSDLFFSFGNQHPGALVLNNFPRFMQDLSVPGNSFFDLGAVDILRARERGVPRYNEFRRQLGLKPIRSFDDLTDDPKALNNLRSVYGGPPDNVEDLDLLIGTLAEAQRPTHFGFGETVFQIFVVSASRRLQADRFYTDCYNEDVYTPEGLRWIDQTDFKTVILRHYPELADTGLANIKNAFEPWDEGPVLSRDSHPLRAWDRDLKPDPWRGDAYRNA